MTEAAPSPPPKPQQNLLKLSLAALGIVFGDIGTSPLYALRECFAPTRGLTVTPEHILGIESLLLWTLALVVCVKYLAFVIRADNKGEGGILALVSLVTQNLRKKTARNAVVIAVLGIVGASLLYSDGILTPAISVLSAVEGLSVITPLFTPYILPLVIVILVALFAFQYRGTTKVAGLFGPILTIWFATMAVLGVAAVWNAPQVLAALNPWYAWQFIMENGLTAFGVLGAVFLAVTGAEVLYADLGHFGKKPIRRAWFFLVFPALVLNYLGQGAYLMIHPGTADHLFFQLAPSWFLYPLVALATAATVIASQAVISGAFSLARQSVQLGFWPRMQVVHTSDETIGQVYVPFINWCLMVGTLALVFFFKESSKLADAYGIAVSTDMLITTGLMIYTARRIWKAPLILLIPLALVFITIDGSFFAANSQKLFSGGWIVAIMALAFSLLMKTWWDGRRYLRRQMESSVMSLDTFQMSLKEGQPIRVKGIAVFLAGNPHGVPLSLLHNLKHNKVLHEKTVVVSVQTDEAPLVDSSQRAQVTDRGDGLWFVVLHFGFSESPDIPRTLQSLAIPGLDWNPMKTTYFLGRESLVINPRKKSLAHWRKKIFWFMSHNALAATFYYNIPPNQVVEISAQKEI